MAPGSIPSAFNAKNSAEEQEFTASAKGTPMTFGRYRGWTLEQLAKQDPEYLVWLQRHSSGIGYRRQIEEILESNRVAAQHEPVPGARR